MQAPTQNVITKKAHGSSKAVDHDGAPDKTIYAPEDGVIDSYQQRGSGTSDAGLALRMRGGTGLHQFAHTSKSLVSVGQKVKRGQPIAIMGNTGYVKAINGDGTHLHYWIQRPDGSYVYPPTFYNEPFTKGDDMPERKYNHGDAVNIANLIGYSLDTMKAKRDWNDAFYSSIQPEFEKLKQQLAKNPKEVIKEVVKEVPVEKVVEKVVTKEVAKEVPGKSIVVDPAYYPAGDLFRALLQKAVVWFNKKG